MSTAQKVLVGVVIVVCLVVGGVLGFLLGGGNGYKVVETDSKGVSGNKYDPASYKDKYPLQYASYMEASKYPEGRDKPGDFGGDKLFDHVNGGKQTELVTLFGPNPFSVYYADDRGHVYALDDLFDSGRTKGPNPYDPPKTFSQRGACVTCKTPYLEQIFDDNKFGSDDWGFAKVPFDEMRDSYFDDQMKEHGSINCATCHDPETHELRIINKALKFAFEKGIPGYKDGEPIDWEKATKQEMRTYVCAQCHVEYYFEPDTFRVVFPWDNGLEFDKQYEHYKTEPNGFKQDFKNGTSGAAILKAQHPDFEAWTTGVHGKAGVACADCHMPYVTKNGEKYSTHDVTSPLRTVENSCMQCHNDQTKEWLIDSVTSIQANFWVQQHEAELAVSKAHQTIKAAKDAGASDEALAEALELVREAQWYWDFVAAENGMGFHNPDQGMKATGQSIVKANEAILSAYKAAGKSL
ncbi:MAG: ammonia-forming cytochrome c nitrite reductase subunit c552 [Peptococcaceae bacterium]|nr:ammonia-forming cytochrome c nitrite reductase subunit c552 [Peptococcaceae bacterium]